MKKIILLFLPFIFLSCTNKVEIAHLNYINGYWQIAKVETPEGRVVDYKINENYDFFSWNKNTGIHKKVRWQPTGKFLTNQVQESIKIKEDKGNIYLQFNSTFGKHTDKVLSISKTEMHLQSENGNKNYYTKVEINGQTNK